MSYTFDPVGDDRRVAERRVQQDEMPNGHNDRGGRDRRIPAIAEHAAIECAKLREELRLSAAMLAKQCDLARAAEAEAVALLALVKAAFSFSKYSAAIHFEPRRPTNEWLDGHRKLIEDLQPKLEAAIDRAAKAE